MKTTTLLQILIIVGAVIESSLGLLTEIGLEPKTITIIRLVGLVSATVIPFLKGKEKQENDI